MLHFKDVKIQILAWEKLELCDRIKRSLCDNTHRVKHNETKYISSIIHIGIVDDHMNTEVKDMLKNHSDAIYWNRMTAVKKWNFTQ